MDELTRKQLRREGNIQAGAVMIYSGIMYACVIILMVVALLMQMIAGVSSDLPNAEIIDGYVLQAAAFSNWGYLLAVITAFAILLLWKKPAYFCQVILAPGRKMRLTDFLMLSAIFFSAQQIFSWWYLLMDAIAGGMGISLEALLEGATADTNDIPMFLYACLLGPIAEEVFFRGLMLRSLERYGKRFAILASSALFALMHGNLLQLPIAFLTGLVLGYVTLEFHFGWAVLLHLMNNFVLADLLPRLYALFPHGAEDWFMTAFMLVCCVATVVILILRRRDVGNYWRSNPSEKGTYSAFLRAPAMVIYLLISIPMFLALPLLSMLS